jgi:TnsA-like endonuclease N terminal
VKDWGRPKTKIRYKLGNRKRNYHPDILVLYHDGRIFLEEVKGVIFNKRQFIKKKHMAEWYCRAKGWTYRVLFEKDLETVF